jgi:hypothetical protein
LDDFIGSGQQAIDNIKVINRTLKNGVKAFLFTIAATEKGLNKVRLYRSKFTINTSILLDNKSFYLLDPESNILNEIEKTTLKELNTKLGFSETNEYHMGMPFSFFYSTPDNSLGLLWSDKTLYNDSNNVQRQWYGLTPREY